MKRNIITYALLVSASISLNTYTMENSVQPISGFSQRDMLMIGTGVCIGTACLGGIYLYKQLREDTDINHQNINHIIDEQRKVYKRLREVEQIVNRRTILQVKDHKAIRHNKKDIKCLKTDLRSIQKDNHIEETFYSGSSESSEDIKHLVS